MCGIAGFYIKEPKFVRTTTQQNRLDDFLNHLLLEIENRGHDATGFMAVDWNGKMILNKEKITASDFVEKRRKLPEKTRVVLAHTRFATQGAPENWHNNHPVIYNSTVVTHNGSIYNDSDVFKKHDLKRTAQVDTEAISAILHKYGLDKADEAVAELRGGMAVAAMNILEPKRVILFKDGNWPIAWYENENIIVWASTGLAIREAWKKVGAPDVPELKELDYFLQGDLVEINDNEIIRKKIKNSKEEDKKNNKRNWYHYGQSFDDEDESDWNVGETTERFLIRDKPKEKPSTNFYRKSRYNCTTIVDRSQPIAALRKKGTGQAVVYRNRKDMRPWEIVKHDDTWDYCYSCKETIARFCMVDTPLWGLICTDCNLLSKTGSRKSALSCIDESTLHDLNGWVDLESSIHYEAMKACCDETGLKFAVVDYMLHRATKTYKETNLQIGDLYDVLAEIFSEKEDELWEQLLDETAEDEAEEIGVEPFHKDKPIIEICWYEGCLSVPTTTNGKGQRLCKTHFDREVKEHNKCDMCKKKAQVYLRNFKWCTYHYNKCSTARCKEVTVGCAPDSKRLCHKHFRGCKGGFQDGDEWAGASRELATV